eukprot:38174-Hanusia_phi.AAC.1
MSHEAGGMPLYLLIARDELGIDKVNNSPCWTRRMTCDLMCSTARESQDGQESRRLDDSVRMIQHTHRGSRMKKEEGSLNMEMRGCMNPRGGWVRDREIVDAGDLVVRQTAQA